MSASIHVFVLEDDYLIRVNMIWALEDAGFKVSAAESLAEARTVLSGNSFDVLVLNIGLPDGDGCDLCGEMRRIGGDCPILMESGYSPGYVMERVLATGANGLLTKPFLQSDLVQYVEFLLNFPRIFAAEVPSETLRRSNRPDGERYAFSMVDQALSSLALLRPFPGSYEKHPITDDKSTPTIPLTEAQFTELEHLLRDLKQFLGENSEDTKEKARIIGAILSLLSSLSAWLAARATVVTDELLKGIVKYGILAYAAHAVGLKDVLVKIVMGLMLSGGPH